MIIKAENLGKKFRNEWIFRHFHHQFKVGHSYAITGLNGSGKSTLLQVISSYIPANEGHVIYNDGDNKNIEIENIFKYLAITSPALELIEDFTLSEQVAFHSKLKPFENKLNVNEFIELLDLTKNKEKQIKFFSSGMKQKLKLGLCLFSNATILLLDEPTTNLDAEGIALYQLLIKNFTEDRLVIISSNDVQEYDFCDEVIAIGDYK